MDSIPIESATRRELESFRKIYSILILNYIRSNLYHRLVQLPSTLTRTRQKLVFPSELNETGNTSVSFTPCVTSTNLVRQRNFALNMNVTSEI